MESSLIVSIVGGVGILISVLMLFCAATGLAIDLRFFLKGDGPIAEFAQKSSVFRTYMVAGGIPVISAILLTLAIRELERLFGSPSGSSTIFLAGITVTGITTLAMYYTLELLHRTTRPEG